MNTTRLSRMLILTGGSIELVMGVVHFVWTFSFIQMPDFENVTNPIKDFIILASLALGLCMTIFACLSFYFAIRKVSDNKSALFFSLSQAILWIVRLIFEFLYPVRIPIYSIENPSNIVIIGVIVIILIYLIPVILMRKVIKS